MLVVVIVVFVAILNIASAEKLFANETLSSCSYSDTCSVSGYTGACVSISAGCCSTGVATSGLCPGSSDIKCCTQSSCSTPSGSGTCMQTSLCSSKGGTSIGGYCTGPSDLQCCVQGAAKTNFGVDIATVLSSSSASCFVSSGVNFIIPRAYRSTGSIDTNACNSLKTASAAGIKTRDVYMFPCPTCSTSAAAQMNEMLSNLNTNCKSYWSGRVWLDIEGSQYWLGSASSNQAWYKNLVNSCSTYGVKCGVYSSASQWSAIFGSTSFTYGNTMPLWYAHYDSNPSFSDFSAFGGWSTPYAKQYNGDLTLCSMDVDKNYAPNF